MKHLSRRSLILGAGAAFIARPARALIAPRNPLVYPGQVAPRFAPSGHVASGNCRYSAIAGGNGDFYNIGRFHACPVNGATVFTGSVDAIIGPALGGYTNAGYGTADIGNYAGVDQNFTLAAIIRAPTVASANVGIFQFEGASPTFLGLNNANIQITTYGVAQVLSSLSLTVGAWFIVASTNNSSTTNFMAVNLQTGQILTSSVASYPGATATPTGQYSIGNTLAAGFAGTVSAVMAAGQFLSLPQLLSWAKAPWDFWYPPVVKPLLFSALAHNTGGAAASSQTLPMTGFGP